MRLSTDFLRRFILLLIVVPLVVCVNTSVRAAVEDNNKLQHVLILNSYHWGFQWTDNQVAGLLEGMRTSGLKLEFHIEQLGVYSRPTKFNDLEFSSYLKWQFGSRKFDLVVATDDAALGYVARQYDAMFRDIPVVFSDVNNLQAIEFPTNMAVTGVREYRDFVATVELARSLQPNARQIVVFGNAADNGAGPRAVQEFLSTMSSDIPVILHLDKSIEEIESIAAAIDPRNIVFSLAYTKDEHGVEFGYGELPRVVSSISPAPIFDLWSLQVRAGYSVGGKVSEPHLQGLTAASLAVRILKGENPANIPIMDAPTKFIFNYPSMNRHGIKLRKLPQNSVVIDSPYAVYEDYKEWIWGTLALLAFLTGTVLVLLNSIRRRRQAETALATARDHLEEQVEERTSELVTTNASLNDTLATLKHAQDQLVESEKMAALGGLVSGVAHEINTPLGVSLTAVSSFDLNASEVVEEYEKDNLGEQQFEEFIEYAKQTTGILMTNLEQASEMVRSFKQVAVDQSVDTSRRINLSQYMHITAESLIPELKARKHRIEINCPLDLTINTYPGVISQILTNLVVNSVRHGFGTDRKEGQIHIDVTTKENGIELVYTDDGKGMTQSVLKNAFEPFFTTARGQGGSGLGLSIVYNLVTHKLNGQITCLSTPGEGVHFTLWVPDLEENGSEVGNLSFSSVQ